MGRCMLKGCSVNSVLIFRYSPNGCEFCNVNDVSLSIGTKVQIFLLNAMFYGLLSDLEESKSCFCRNAVKIKDVCSIHYWHLCYFCTRKNKYIYMKGIWTLGLLLLSNVFMTLAWYGHLRLQHTGVSRNWPLILVILFSWGIALFEYACQVPANRIGYIENGGPFTLVQLKVVQEVVSLVVFTVIAGMLFKGESLGWNHLAAFVCLVAAVYFVFMK